MDLGFPQGLGEDSSSHPILLLDKRAGCEVECTQDSFYPARPPLIVLARNRVEGGRLSYQTAILFKINLEFQFA